MVSIPGVPVRRDHRSATRHARFPRDRPGSHSSRSSTSSCTPSPARRWPTCCSSIGLALLLFELFTAGVGVAGVVGAGAFVLGCYGLGVLPTRPSASRCSSFAMFGYAIDVQTGVPGFWTGIGTVSFVVGSLTLYDGLSLSWITLLVGHRRHGAGHDRRACRPWSAPGSRRPRSGGSGWSARWAGRHGGVAPTASSRSADAPWRARTNRATPIDAGDPVRVVAIDGLVLEVEPLEGGPRLPRAPFVAPVVTSDFVPFMTSSTSPKFTLDLPDFARL